jgi:hypothetical protein
VTALWVTLGICGFLTLLMLLRFGIEASVTDKRILTEIGQESTSYNVEVALRAAGLRHVLLPRKPAKKLRPPIIKKRKPAKKKPDKPKKPLSEHIQSITALLQSVRHTKRPPFRSMHVSLNAFTVIGTDDACKTAKEYGAVCAALSILTPLLYQTFDVHNCSIRVDADFSVSWTRVGLDVQLTTCLGSLILDGLAFLIAYLYYRPKTKVKEENKSGRKGYKTWKSIRSTK